jgi:hypothetical protein
VLVQPNLPAVAFLERELGKIWVTQKRSDVTVTGVSEVFFFRESVKDDVVTKKDANMR